jgi:transposase InsO family protein
VFGLYRLMALASASCANLALGCFLLNRDFNQQKSNTHWIGDITYIKTYQGCY